MPEPADAISETISLPSTDERWPDSFEDLLRSFLTSLDDNRALTADLTLAEHGLDSLATISLLIEIEEKFGIEIPDEQLTNGSFSTAGRLWSVIRSLLN
jgi:acyl carrier protein